MCNCLKEVELGEIESRHVRLLEKEVKKFNQYITLYCISRKDFLSQGDLSLFNKLSKFNQILILSLLRDDYFDIGFFSTLSDLVIHQPMEFAADHPWLTALIAAAVIGSLGYLACDKFLKKKVPTT